jgi:hypothetical protein
MSRPVGCYILVRRRRRRRMLAGIAIMVMLRRG